MIGEIFGGRASKSRARHGLRNGISHEGVGKDFFESGSFGGIKDQYFGDEVACVIGDGDMFWEGVSAGLDFLVGGLDFGSLEWRLSDELRVTV